jgi:osmoprotectant transport system permease protein
VTWFLDHIPEVLDLTWQHVYLAGVPLLLGLLIALPLGWMARRYRPLYLPFTAGFGLLYTIPSLALFILMPGILGTRILDTANVIVAMTLYTVALLVRTVADGLGSVPEDAAQAATAMGFGRGRRFFAVELPLAVPVISAGLRVAAVSNVSIVSVGAIIGIPQLGLLFTDGFNRTFYDPIVVGVIGCILLALLFDLTILGVTRALTPWLRVAGARP